MGDCKYCGESAGILRSKHAECESKNSRGTHEMVKLALTAASGTGPLAGLPTRLGEIAAANFVPTSYIRQALIDGWTRGAQHMLNDGDLNEDEEQALGEYREAFSLGQSDLDDEGWYTKVIGAGVLRQLLNEEEITVNITTDITLPFNFQKSEQLVWVFGNVPYYEQKTQRQMVGRSHGLSIRVARGVYYRPSTFSSEAVERTVTEHVDDGVMGITTKHIYFSGSTKKFRIPYAKMVTIDPYEDGIGIMRDAQSAKPQTFITSDGWFTYNLVMNLADR